MAKALRYNIENALVLPFRVAAANTVREGVPVMFSGDDIVECNSDDDLAIGIAYRATTGTWPAAALSMVDVIMRGSPCVAPVRSTAAGMTKGAFVCPGAAGCVDVVVGGGAVITNVLGQALETATADGELIGVNLGAQPPTVTAA